MKSFIDVRLLSRVWLYDPVDCSTPGFSILHHLPELAQTHVHWVGDASQPPPPPPLIPSPPSLHLSPNQGLFNNLARCIRWPKYWSFSISPSNEYSRMISFRMDWLHLRAVQGTLKSLFQHHSSKASILGALSLLYGPTLTSIHDFWKNHGFDYMDLCQQSEVPAFKYAV